MINALKGLTMVTMHFATSTPTGPNAARHKATFSFTEAIAEPGHAPLLSPARYIELLRTDINTFAINAHVHRNTVSRAPGAASVQDYLRKNLRVLSAAFDASGQDAAKALQWFGNEPLAPFGYKTAEQLVSDGRIDDVLRLIDSYATGAAG